MPRRLREGYMPNPIDAGPIEQEELFVSLLYALLYELGARYTY